MARRMFKTLEKSVTLKTTFVLPRPEKKHPNVDAAQNMGKNKSIILK
jgi:hypothetical protein